MMILSQIINFLTGLTEFLKYGLPGLSAIVFILAYRMLSKEQSRDGDARDNVLGMIKTFLWIAFVFLITSGIWTVISNNDEKKNTYSDFNIQVYYRDTGDEGISGKTVNAKHYRDDAVIRHVEGVTDILGAKLFSFRNVNPYTDFFRIEWKKAGGITEFQEFNPLNHRVLTLKETN